MSYLLFFWQLTARDLWSSHEARAGLDAQTILDRGWWELPGLPGGRTELQKPPLYYWMVAGLARLRGRPVDAAAVRLPAALSALGCVLVLIGLGRALGRSRAGLLAAVVLATAVHFTWLARIGRIDMPLTLAVTLAGAAFYRGLRLGRRAWLLAGYLAVALGVLLKGPIGAVLPAAVVAGYLLAEGEWPACWEVRAWGRLVRRLGLAWGLPLVAVLTLPCFVWVEVRSGGAFSRVFLWHHNVTRGFGGSSLRTSPWWYYPAFFAGDFLPWTPLFLLAVCGGRPRASWRSDPDARFGLAWLLAVAVILSAVRFKRADYLLPAYPGAALFLGCWADRRLAGLDRAVPFPGRRVLALLFPVVVVLATVGWVVRVGWYLPAREALRDYRRFARAVRNSAPAGDVLFFRTEAHALAFHLRMPLAIVVRWDELYARLNRPGVHRVVLPPDCASQAPLCLPGIRIEQVIRNTDLAGGRHERPLVLLRIRGGPSHPLRRLEPATPKSPRSPCWDGRDRCTMKEDR